MGYESIVTGEVKPGTVGLRALLDYLEQKGYTLEQDRSSEEEAYSIMAPDGSGTGLCAVDGVLWGTEEPASSYGFDDQLIETLVGASREGLVEDAFLHREGQDHDDQEHYDYTPARGGVTDIYHCFSVPLDTEKEAREAIVKAGKKIAEELSY